MRDIRLDRKATSTGEEEALRRAVERLPEHFRVPLVPRAEGKSYRQVMPIS